MRKLTCSADLRCQWVLLQNDKIRPLRYLFAAALLLKLLFTVKCEVHFVGMGILNT